MRKYRGRKVEIRSVVAEPERDGPPEESWGVNPAEYDELADFAEELGIPEAAAILRSKPGK